jgi:hypothetical protein
MSGFPRAWCWVAPEMALGSHLVVFFGIQQVSLDRNGDFWAIKRCHELKLINHIISYYKMFILFKLILYQLQRCKHIQLVLFLAMLVGWRVHCCPGTVKRWPTRRENSFGKSPAKIDFRCWSWLKGWYNQLFADIYIYHVWNTTNYLARFQKYNQLFVFMYETIYIYYVWNNSISYIYYNYYIDYSCCCVQYHILWFISNVFKMIYIQLCVDASVNPMFICYIAMDKYCPWDRWFIMSSLLTNGDFPWLCSITRG